MMEDDPIPAVVEASWDGATTGRRARDVAGSAMVPLRGTAMGDTPQPRRLRFRLRTLLIGIAFLALLLVNVVRWVRLQEQRVLAERSVAEAMRAQAEVQAALLQAQAAAGPSSTQAAQKAAKPPLVPTTADPGAKTP
jgi:hypothetical protein